MRSNLFARLSVHLFIHSNLFAHVQKFSLLSYSIKYGKQVINVFATTYIYTYRVVIGIIILSNTKKKST